MCCCVHVSIACMPACLCIKADPGVLGGRELRSLRVLNLMQEQIKGAPKGINVTEEIWSSCSEDVCQCYSTGQLQKLTIWCHWVGRNLLKLINKCEVRHWPLLLTSPLLIGHCSNRRSLLWWSTVVFGMWMPNISTGYHRPLMVTGRGCWSDERWRDHRHL